MSKTDMIDLYTMNFYTTLTKKPQMILEKCNICHYPLIEDRDIIPKIEYTNEIKKCLKNERIIDDMVICIADYIIEYVDKLTCMKCIYICQINKCIMPEEICSG